VDKRYRVKEDIPDEMDEKRLEWMNDFENMFPTSYDQRHEELRIYYPEFYEEIIDD
jgi:hypothetical protein